MERALVTGASGFVGRALAQRLEGPFDTLSLGASDWAARLDAARFEGATIFHLAARVHAPDERGERAFHDDNVEKSRRLAEVAAQRGARRLVFLSSIKVHGEESRARPFRVDDAPAPEDAYARSKLAAEQALTRVAAETGISLTIVRPPLVYGAGARGNLATLLRVVDTPWPLPFASASAPRSFVHVDDLARLLVECGAQPAADGRTYIAAHPRSVAIPEVIALLRHALGRPERLCALPPALLEAAAAAIGRGATMRRLTRSLEADPSGAERDLGWQARIPIEQALDEMARAWRSRDSK